MRLIIDAQVSGDDDASGCELGDWNIGAISPDRMEYGSGVDAP